MISELTEHHLKYFPFSSVSQCHKFMEGPIFTLQIRGMGPGNETPLGLLTVNSQTDGQHRSCHCEVHLPDMSTLIE